MFCKRCGQELKEGAKFCGKCGASAEYGNKSEKILRVCPKCGFQTTKDEFYCESCGTLLNVDQTVTENGNLLRKYSNWFLFVGRPAPGIARAIGQLCFYDDRVEFKKFLGNAPTNMYGAAGMESGIKTGPVLSYYYRNIEKTDIEKYAGIYNTVVLVMRNGSEITLSPPVPNSKQPAEIRDLLKLYIQ